MDTFSYSMFYGCWMVLAISLTFLFYYKIYRKIRESKLTQKMIGGVTIQEGRDQNSNLAAMKKEIRFVKTSFKIFIAFVCFWSPTALLILMGTNSFVPKPVYLFSLFFAHSNSTLNFFIYYIDNMEFKKGFWSLVQKVFGIKYQVTGGASVAPAVANNTARF